MKDTVRAKRFHGLFSAEPATEEYYDIPIREITQFPPLYHEYVPYVVRLSQYITEHGDSPIYPVSQPTVRKLRDGSYQLMTGFIRYYAEILLKAEHLTCRLLDVTDEEVLRLQFDEAELKKARIALLSEYRESHGTDTAVLAKILCVSEAYIKGLLGVSPV